MELSLLCESNILLCVCDKDEKMTIYATGPDTLRTIQENIFNLNANKERASEPTSARLWPASESSDKE